MLCLVVKGAALMWFRASMKLRLLVKEAAQLEAAVSDGDEEVSSSSPSSATVDNSGKLKQILKGMQKEQTTRAVGFDRTASADFMSVMKNEHSMGPYHSFTVH